MKKDFKAVTAALSGLSRIADADELLELSVDEIHENPRNARQHFDPATIEELSESIRRDGIIEPLVVTPREEGGYVLLAGHRRRRAALLIDLRRVPAIVRRKVDDGAHERITLIENLQREDLGPIDIATTLRRMLDMDIAKQGEHGARSRIAREIGKAPAYVSRYLGLLDLPPDVRAIANDLLVVDPARLLKLGMLDDKARAIEVESIRNPSVRHHATPDASAATPPASTQNTEGRAASKPKTAPRTSPPADPNTTAFAQKIATHLATAVTIVRKGEGGELRIHFANPDVLEGLRERLGLPGLDD